MKAIHKKRSWEYGSTDTAKKPICCFQMGLFLTTCKSVFITEDFTESGVPTIRNKEGGHGRGDEVTNVPEHLASYTLHLTASNLLFLAKCDENFTKKNNHCGGLYLSTIFNKLIDYCFFSESPLYI
jgi:hypothetical protein